MLRAYQSSANWYEDNIQSVDDYWSKRPSKIKNTIRRKRKKLVNNNDFQLVVHNGDDVIKSLADFHKVYQQSWKVNEVYPAFIDEIARQFHSTNKLRMGFVYHGGNPVAAQLWFVERGVASIFKLAHVPEFEQQSVGSVLTAEMFNWVIAHDEVKKVDFLTGNDVYKKDWMSNSQPLYTVTAFNKKTGVGLYWHVQEHARQRSALVKKELTRTELMLSVLASINRITKGIIMSLEVELKQLLQDCLQLDEVSQWQAETEILGAVPEFDSMAIVTVLTQVEENYGVIIEDDEVSAEVFETLGSLMSFVAEKLG